MSLARMPRRAGTRRGCRAHWGAFVIGFAALALGPRSDCRAGLVGLRRLLPRPG
ncbi:unnamed protein product [Amoebophrya sp. A120]|nr:unnamed protein product [Amoebophrya sp. A120]|eukprot:GSA120T00015769001.1